MTKHDPTEIGLGSEIQIRRERVFMILGGLFIGSMTMLNLLGVTRFVDLGFDIGGTRIPIVLAIGVLPYPVTFLCTDFISELYGRRRANFLVLVGFLVNVWLAFILWLGGVLPGAGADVGAVTDAAGRLPLFFEIRNLTLGVVAASMIAYLAAQLVDVQVFHFWKRLTGGKHLWLRNNGSTLVSQFVDSFAVISITYWIGGLVTVVDSSRPVWPQLWGLILTAYIFKILAALVDT
ncbi:MAG: queuosine precursor transporter, partial [Acidobacteriota bacterium]